MGWLLEGPGAQVSNWGGCGIWGQRRNLFVWVSMRQQGTPAHPRAAAGWMGCLTPAARGSIVSLCVCTCVRMCVCVCTCAYWEYTFSLTAGWTWGLGAAAASPLSGYQIWTTPNTLALPEVFLKSPCNP